MIVMPIRSSASSWRSKIKYSNYAKKEFSVSFTQEELAEALKKAFKDDKSDLVDKETISVKVGGDGVYVSGKILKPLSGTLTVGINGTVQNGGIIPRLTYIKFGFLRLPSGFIERQIISRLLPDWQRSINLKNVEWTEGKLETGNVILKGRMTKKAR